MSSGPKTETVSKNPAWLDRAGEEIYNLGKSAVFQPAQSGGKYNGTVAAPFQAYTQPYAPTNSQPAGFQPNRTFSNYAEAEAFVNKSRSDHMAGLLGLQPGSYGSSTTMQPANTGGSSTQFRDFVPYSGQRVAEMSGDLSAASDVANTGFMSAYDVAAPWIGKQYEVNPLVEAMKYMESGDVDRYFNPFIEKALDPAARDLSEATDKRLAGIRSNASKVGAFGNSRMGLLEAEAEGDFAQEVSDLYSQGYAGAFDRAIAAYMQEKNRVADAEKFTEGQRFDSFRDVADRALRGAELKGNLAQRQFDALMQSGSVQQAINQQKLDNQYADYLEARDWDKNQVRFLAELAGSSPSQGAMGQIQKPDRMGQILGAGVSLGSAALLKSDRRFKKDIKWSGRSGDYNLYTFRYKDDPDTVYRGVMAEEVAIKNPDAVKTINGVLHVDYDKIGYTMERVNG